MLWENPFSHSWSTDPRDAVFSAHHHALSTHFSGFSVFSPIYGDHMMNHTLRHAINSTIFNPQATATFMCLPSWGPTPMTIEHCSKFLAAYPHIYSTMGTIPSIKLFYDTPQFWIDQEIPLSHTWSLHVYCGLLEFRTCKKMSE